MESRRRKFVLLSLSIFLLVIAAAEFFSYVAQGVAYGAVLGLRGREQDLRIFAFLGSMALVIALLCEALAVAILSCYSWLSIKRHG